MNDKQRVHISDMVPIIEETVKNGKTVKLKIMGESMSPTLMEDRDSVTLAKPGRIKTGDVIFYKRDNGHFVLHRVVGKKNGCYKLCGDNQVGVEFPIRPDQVIAVVTEIHRKGETIKVNDFLYSLWVFVWTHSIKFRPFLIKIIFRIKAHKNKK